MVEAKYRSSKDVVYWEMIRTVNVICPQGELRMKVTYSNGNIRVLAPSFATRSAMDRYIGRWLPEFPGIERTIV